ncbi:MAG: helix-turn-helix domain-containing protein [Acidimicrobiales bacterium]
MTTMPVRSTVYVLMASGELPSVKVGRSRRLRIADVEEYVERLGASGSSAHRRGA